MASRQIPCFRVRRCLRPRARGSTSISRVDHGPKMKGTVKGIDYLHIRADGRCQLHIHAEITTEDGKKISLAADGVGIPQKGRRSFSSGECDAHNQPS